MSEITVLKEVATMEDKVERPEVFEIDAPTNPIPWPDPSQEDLQSPVFEAIWQTIKTWDINVPEVYSGYTGAEGNHAKAILDALKVLGYEPGEQRFETTS